MAARSTAGDGDDDDEGGSWEAGEGATVMNPGDEKSQEADAAVQKRKLLILDINGLLLDTYHTSAGVPEKPGYIKLHQKYVYKRPHCDDFVKFCLKHFRVGIWSAAKRHNVNRMVKFIFGEANKQLDFAWSQEDCTHTDMNVYGSNYKPLNFKDLTKVWKASKPNVPWDCGDYGPWNTLLIDDSPYKILLNPEYTAILPAKYHCTVDDDVLVVVQSYLERLLECEDVRDFVKANPIGQEYMTLDHPQWKHYAEAKAQALKRDEEQARKLLADVVPGDAEVDPEMEPEDMEVGHLRNATEGGLGRRARKKQRRRNRVGGGNESKNNRDVTDEPIERAEDDADPTELRLGPEDEAEKQKERRESEKQKERGESEKQKKRRESEEEKPRRSSESEEEEVKKRRLDKKRDEEGSVDTELHIRHMESDVRRTGSTFVPRGTRSSGRRYEGRDEGSRRRDEHYAGRGYERRRYESEDRGRRGRRYYAEDRSGRRYDSEDRHSRRGRYEDEYPYGGQDYEDEDPYARDEYEYGYRHQSYRGRPYRPAFFERDLRHGGYDNRGAPYGGGGRTSESYNPSDTYGGGGGPSQTYSGGGGGPSQTYGGGGGRPSQTYSGGGGGPSQTYTGGGFTANYYLQQHNQRGRHHGRHQERPPPEGHPEGREQRP